MIDQSFEGFTSFVDLLVVKPVDGAIRVAVDMAEPLARLQLWDGVEGAIAGGDLIRRKGALHMDVAAQVEEVGFEGVDHGSWVSRRMSVPRTSRIRAQRARGS